MRSYSWYSICSIGVLLIACSKPLPELQGIDLQSWKADHYGCTGKREASIETMREQKDELLSLTEMQIVEILGRPDQNELYKRNQKFYYYYLQPGNGCTTHEPNPIRLSVRFNAMGLAKEISVD